MLFPAVPSWINRHGDDDMRALNRLEAIQQPMQASHSDIINSLDPVPHDVGGDGRFLRHRQIAGPGREHGDGPRSLGQRLPLKSQAARQLMINGFLELPSNRARLVFSDPRDEQALFSFENLAGDLGNLVGSLAFAINNLGEILAQRAMQVHLGKSQISQRRGLESTQNLAGSDAPRAKLLQQSDGFGRCHNQRLPRGARLVTQEKPGSACLELNKLDGDDGVESGRTSLDLLCFGAHLTDSLQ